LIDTIVARPDSSDVQPLITDIDLAIAAALAKPI